MENIGIEQQISVLEKQLQEKRIALEQQGSSPENMPSEKETLHEIVGEKIQEQAPQYIPRTQIQSPPPPQVQDIPSYFDQELKDKIQELINTVFTNNIEAGIKNAVSSNNPALLDAFHDILVDELYNALIERKKIQEVK